MRKKIIKTEKEMFVEECKECGKEITGFSENQVNVRIGIHKKSHRRRI